MPRVKMMTPVLVNGERCEVYDIVDVSDEDYELMYNRGWCSLVPADTELSRGPKPVATVIPDLQQETE